jgi:hypothetical protein
VSNEVVKVPVGIAINEWFHDGHPSRIISLTYQEEGKPESDNIAREISRTADGLFVKEAIVAVSGGGRITISNEFEETHYENGWCVITYAAPTSNPTVVIYAPETLETNAQFDHREGITLKKMGLRTWQLQGMLLPRQNIRIHWYRKDKSQGWLQGTVRA